MNPRTLKSGIVVDADQYYKLLEWKDANTKKFMFFCESYFCSYSINEMSIQSYNALLQFANLD